MRITPLVVRPGERRSVVVFVARVRVPCENPQWPRAAQVFVTVRLIGFPNL